MNEELQLFAEHIVVRQRKNPGRETREGVTLQQWVPRGLQGPLAG